MRAGAADTVLNSLRDRFNAAAAEIAIARSLIDPESTAEMILESGEPELIAAWKTLNQHLRVINQIAAIASQFGPRLGWFGQVEEYALGDGHKLDDRALMCCDGELVSDSALFGRPDQGHRNSPWFKTTLKLHSIESARTRYAIWASVEHDRINSSDPGGWVDMATGEVHPHPKPENPYRQKVST
jgi:hypothetical protein